jgi:multimeric flavodoxin WrbA
LDVKDGVKRGGVKMKALGIMASPRKGGNSDIVLETFFSGARSVGAETEKIYLYDCNIGFCRGCFRKCWITDYSCSQYEDDMDSIHRKMEDSELLVFSSPVYCGTPPAKLISFFERSIDQKKVNLETLVVERNKLEGKKAVVLQVNFFKEIAYQNLPSLVYDRILGEIFKMEIVARLGVSDVNDPGDIHEKKESLREAYDLGVRICGGS